jgi:hypothetical protein
MQFAGMHEAYPILRDLVLEHGREVAPRGEPTRELLAVTFSVDDAVHRGVPLGCGRKVGIKMQAIDGTGNLAGASYPDVAIRLAGVMDRFADDLPSDLVFDHDSVERWEDALEIRSRQPNLRTGNRFFQGAYGPRIGDQLEAVEDQLRRDPDTRQAVVNLWSETDRDPRWRDRPCTTHLQFMVREGRLDAFVSMRANDLWTGTCYDVFQFGQVQAAMAHVLGIPPGTYHHHATSLHIYERDVEKFEAVRGWEPERLAVRELGRREVDYVDGEAVPAVDNPRESWGPDWAGLRPGSYQSWSEVRHAFGTMLGCASRREAFQPQNRVEQWYWDVVRKANEEAK